MTAVANVLSRESPAPASRQPDTDIAVIGPAAKMDGPDAVVKQHLILGTDKEDAEMQRDLWLAENPSIKVIRLHDVKREPPTLLTRIGSKNVPRVSVMVEYEEPNVSAE